MNFLKDTLSYPVRKGGKYILLIGGVLTIVTKVVSLAPVIGIIAWFLLFGYFCAMYFQIIQSSAIGGEEAPEYPELSNIMEDILWPMLQIVFILLLSFGPLWIYSYLAGDNANHWSLLILFGFAVFYAPMAVLGTVVLGSVRAVSPLIVFPSILRAGWLYLATVGLLIAIYGLEMLVSAFVSDSLILGSILMSFIGMYTMMANGRALGLIYREREEELNWL